MVVVVVVVVVLVVVVVVVIVVVVAASLFTGHSVLESSAGSSGQTRGCRVKVIDGSTP